MAGLTEDEKKAIVGYTGIMYLPYNRALRQRGAQVLMAELDDAIIQLIKAQIELPTYNKQEAIGVMDQLKHAQVVIEKAAALGGAPDAIHEKRAELTQLSENVNAVYIQQRKTLVQQGGQLRAALQSRASKLEPARELAGEHAHEIELVISGLAKLEAYQGTVYRRMKFYDGSEFGKQEWDRLAPGNIIDFKAFTSTSRSDLSRGPYKLPGDKAGYLAILQWESKTGKDIVSLAHEHMKVEAEILYPPELRLKITSIEQVPVSPLEHGHGALAVKRVQCEELEPDAVFAAGQVVLDWLQPAMSLKF